MACRAATLSDKLLKRAPVAKKRHVEIFEGGISAVRCELA